MKPSVKHTITGFLCAALPHAVLLVVILLVAAATQSTGSSLFANLNEDVYLVYAALIIGLFSMILYFRMRRRTGELLPIFFIIGAFAGQVSGVVLGFFAAAPVFDVIHFQNRNVDMWGVRFSVIALFLLHFVMLFVDFSVCSSRKKKQLEEDENIARLREQWEADVAALIAQ